MQQIQQNIIIQPRPTRQEYINIIQTFIENPISPSKFPNFKHFPFKVTPLHGTIIYLSIRYYIYGLQTNKKKKAATLCKIL